MTIVIQRNLTSDKVNKKEPQTDDDFMEIVQNARRNRTLSPRQSNFRVAALIVYRNHNIEVSSTLINLQQKREKHTTQYLMGHNDESCCLLNSCCAEKSAFLQLADQPLGTIVSCVYLVSDLPEVIHPGVICREFMLSSPYISNDTQIIMEGDKGISTRIKCSLIDLYPYPSPYLKLNANEQIKEGLRLQSLHVSTNIGILKNDHLLIKIRELAMKGCSYDKDMDLHPIAYGAAIIFDDFSEGISGQKKALEYGCSQDPICQLAPYLETRNKRKSSTATLSTPTTSSSNHVHNNKEKQPLIICMCDQYGVCHAPFSPGRAFLVEHGFGDVKVLCQDQYGNFFTPQAKELIPAVPEWSGN